MLPRRKPLRSGIERAPKRDFEKHARWIRGFCCVACKAIGQIDAPAGDPRRKIEAAHVRTGTDGATALKPSSWWLIPLCGPHHSRQHTIGEAAFEKEFGIDMKREALMLARVSPDQAMKDAARAAGVL